MRVKSMVKHGEVVVPFYVDTRSRLTQVRYPALMRRAVGRTLTRREKFVWGGRASPARPTRISPLLRGTTWAEAHRGQSSSLRHNIPKQEKSLFDIAKYLT